jgi:hypothetical protein
VIPATALQEELISDTQAPPMTSSSMLSSPPPSSDHRGAQISTETKGKRRRKDQGHISTLELQSLLPRARRTKHVYEPQDDMDLTDSSAMEAPDRSEETARAESVTSLSEPEPEPEPEPEEPTPPRPSRRKTRTKSVSKAAKPVPRRPLQPTPRANATSRKTAAKTPKGASRKYSAKARAEEQENEEDVSNFVDLDEDTIVEQDAQTQMAMERIRAKFAAVDEWEMEFETVDYSSASSTWR